MKTIITDVFFDLDHTLWDFEKNSALAFETIFKNYQIEIDLDKFLVHYIPINLKYWEMYRTEQITQTQLIYGRLKDTFDLIQYQISALSGVRSSPLNLVYLLDFYLCHNQYDNLVYHIYNC